MSYSLIVTIVRRGWGSTVLQASIAAGAGGGTVLGGRGAGINEKDKVFGVAIEPEKEIVLTLVPTAQADEMLAILVKAAELEEVGRGIAFVLPVDRVVGMAHLLVQSPPDPSS